MEKSGKGDHSRKKCAGDDEKPLKKARYLWEVKGKSHLKNAPSDIICDIEPQITTPTINLEKPCCSSVETGDAKKQASKSPSSSRSCCLETFLAKTEDIMDKDSSDEDESEKLPLESSIENEIPVTLVSPRPKNQDYYLRKWQARQIARGFVDNTINSMLENWVDRPFDASNLVDDCENDGQLEDDAILMAIQSHGLQSGWRGGSSNSTFNSNSNSSFNSNYAMAGSSRSESRVDSISSNTILQNSSTDDLENIQKEQENESSVASSSSSMSVDTTSSISNPYETDLEDPMDFLNAAVSVAIQKKGLSYG